MSVMYHSVIFQDPNNVNRRKNTWTDWHLIPVSRPIIAQPTPIYKYVDIPGKDGSLDITDYLTGRPTYSDRKGSLEFYVENDGVNWSKRMGYIAEFLTGAKMKVILEDYPNYYYLGRVFFKDWKTDASSNHSRVIIDYQLNPFWYWSNGKEGWL